ncbi:MAG: hypothetical protein HYZ28_20085 [Myxococcales bacterium]|nr:hypothetical protein [Myxococcales bacterium]
MAVPVTGRCARHPSDAAVELCRRCGGFLCGECIQLHADEPYCEDCLKVVLRPESRRSLVAVALATASAVLGFYGLVAAAVLLATEVKGGPLFVMPAYAPGVAGMVMGYQERAKVRTGEAARKGRIYADAAVYLGWADVVMAAISAFLGLMSLAIR